MAVKFTCDLCGKEFGGQYDGYEGWDVAEIGTLEWWEENDPKKGFLGYHVRVFCHIYDPGEESCYKQFLRENNITYVPKLGTYFQEYHCGC